MVPNLKRRDMIIKHATCNPRKGTKIHKGHYLDNWGNLNTHWIIQYFINIKPPDFQWKHSSYIKEYPCSKEIHAVLLRGKGASFAVHYLVDQKKIIIFYRWVDWKREKANVAKC